MKLAAACFFDHCFVAAAVAVAAVVAVFAVVAVVAVVLGREDETLVAWAGLEERWCTFVAGGVDLGERRVVVAVGTAGSIAGLIHIQFQSEEIVDTVVVVVVGFDCNWTNF